MGGQNDFRIPVSRSRKPRWLRKSSVTRGRIMEGRIIGCKSFSAKSLVDSSALLMRRYVSLTIILNSGESSYASSGHPSLEAGIEMSNLPTRSLAELARVKMLLELARPSKQVFVDHRSDFANHRHHRISDLQQIDLIGNPVQR